MNREVTNDLFVGDGLARGNPFGLDYEDFLRHVYVVGKTGTGKATLQTEKVLQMIYGDQGVCFIDPHGDAVEKILEYIPAQKTNDVIYFDPSDSQHPIAFNVLAT
jgi:DNA helicase HerA-like ATPase